jgi:predicted regulator of Ras-like GTPase activity (Roadblock/LC7/MglB family)
VAEAIVTTIGALCEAWPEAIRQEIEKTGANDASVCLPLNRLETAMKTGRVLFAWGELIDWLAVPPAAPSPHRGTQVELPLKVIAPLFMAKHRGSAQKKISLGDNVPDLFVGLAKPAAAPPAAETKMPAETPKVPELEVAQSPGAEDVLGRIFGQPSKGEWSLQEIVQEVNRLPGVAYGLLATADGLLVAGQAPAPLNASTLAAFLPQIFGRAAHYAGEARLGALEALTLTVGQAPHRIIKAGTLYLAVVGRPGESLPEAALHSIAGQLARRNQ